MDADTKTLETTKTELDSLNDHLVKLSKNYPQDTKALRPYSIKISGLISCGINFPSDYGPELQGFYTNELQKFSEVNSQSLLKPYIDEITEHSEKLSSILSSQTNFSTENQQLITETISNLNKFFSQRVENFGHVYIELVNAIEGYNKKAPNAKKIPETYKSEIDFFVNNDTKYTEAHKIRKYLKKLNGNCKKLFQKSDATGTGKKRRVSFQGNKKGSDDLVHGKKGSDDLVHGKKGSDDLDHGKKEKAVKVKGQKLPREVKFEFMTGDILRSFVGIRTHLTLPKDPIPKKEVSLEEKVEIVNERKEKIIKQELARIDQDFRKEFNVQTTAKVSTKKELEEGERKLKEKIDSNKKEEEDLKRELESIDRDGSTSTVGAENEMKRLSLLKANLADLENKLAAPIKKDDNKDLIMELDAKLQKELVHLLKVENATQDRFQKLAALIERLFEHLTREMETLRALGGDPNVDQPNEIAEIISKEGIESILARLSDGWKFVAKNKA